jgi:hypothetical protein
MYLSVMEPAERHEVREFGFAAMRPVVNVMAVNIACK